MNKLILLILGFITFTANATACSPNLLNATFEFTLLETSEPGTSLAFCKSLQAGSSCCSAFIINKFQQNANAWVDYYEAIALTRDNVLFTKRNETHAKNETFIQYLQTVNNAIPTLENENDPQYDDMITTLSKFKDLITPLVENYDAVQNNFTAYQERRSECMITALLSQASAWCLTCDPNQAANGLSNTGVDYGDDLKARILSACYPFLDVSASQSNILYLDAMYEYLEGLQASAQLVIDGDLQQALDDFAAVNDGIQSVLWGDNATELPVFFPEDCTEASCEWLFTDFFVNGVFSENELIFGGVLPTNPDQNPGRLLKQARKPLNRFESSGGRRLAGKWNPAADESGITASFKINPGYIDNENEMSGLRNKVIACLAIFSIFLLG